MLLTYGLFEECSKKGHSHENRVKYMASEIVTTIDTIFGDSSALSCQVTHLKANNWWLESPVMWFFYNFLVLVSVFIMLGALKNGI